MADALPQARLIARTFSSGVLQHWAYHDPTILRSLFGTVGCSMRLGPKFSAVLPLVAVLLVGGVSGQTASSGALSGVVIDKTNAVVPDATVEITDVAKGTTDSTKTNGEGVYQFSFLRPGKYAFRVAHPGFQEERRSVTVQVGPTVTVNITLQVVKSSCEITVSS